MTTFELLKNMKTKLVLLLTSVLCLFAQPGVSEDKTVIRFGHFPNITHAQGVVAHALSRQGKGWFEQRLGPNVQIQWFNYNAGPSEWKQSLRARWT